MKVFQQRSWAVDSRCFGCTSDLQVEASDIEQRRFLDMGGVYENEFGYTCVVCGTFNKLNYHNIPDAVKDAARARRDAGR